MGILGGITPGRSGQNTGHMGRSVVTQVPLACVRDEEWR